VTPIKALGFLGLVLVSFGLSRAAATGADSNRLEGLLVPVAFLLVAVPLVYLAIRWTPSGPIRWSLVLLVTALPSIVAVQLLASWVLQ
jgi:hypothetical protein